MRKKNVLGALALSLLAACGQPGNNSNLGANLTQFTVPDTSGAPDGATAVMMSGSSVSDCTAVGGSVYGYSGDGDLYAAIPANPANIYEDNYLCIVIGVPKGYVGPILDDITLVADEDCDDSDPLVTTASVATYTDGDSDGHGAGTALMVCGVDPSDITSHDDCDDSNGAIHPGAMEVCNSVDDNCDGTIDEGVTITVYADNDGDGHGDLSNPMEACDISAGWILDSSDCDDGDPNNFPGNMEDCDLADNDCSMVADDNLTEWSVGVMAAYPDMDMDLYGDMTAASTLVCSLSSTQSLDHTDCNDANSGISPGDTEILDNLVDEDCDGVAEQTPIPTDADGDGYDAIVYGGTDCNDTIAAINPGASEVCDGTDNDCDALVDDADPGITGQTTWHADSDGDTYGASATSAVSCSAPSGSVASSTDCNDSSASINPAAIEVCDNVDQDCDSMVDDGVPTATVYTDSDLDGYGSDTASAMTACEMAGRSTLNTDCDDALSAVNPGAMTINNDNLDNNCDGVENAENICFTADLATDTWDPAAHGEPVIYFQLWIDDMSDGTTDGNGDMVTDYAYPGLVQGNSESQLCGSYPLTTGHSMKINSPFSNTAATASFTAANAVWWGYMNSPEAAHLVSVTYMGVAATPISILSWGSGSDGDFTVGALPD